MAKSDSDILDELAKLPSQENYLPMDRYRDFQKVFGNAHGKRVLREILSWGRMFKSPVLGKPIDPYAMAVAFGERNIALKIMAAIYNEPPDKPTRQKS